jgi:hypothetical protein
LDIEEFATYTNKSETFSENEVIPEEKKMGDMRNRGEIEN